MEQTSTEARLTAEQRRRSAVIVREVDGRKVYKFPIPNKAHARQALRMLDESDLTDEEKEKVRKKAKEVLGADEYSRWIKEADSSDEVIAPTYVFENEIVDEEASEARGGIGSVGGHDPRADKRPLRNLVDSFGKWAKGKQSTCVRVLTTRHPELCAGRPGGCNALCAYLKDQFLGTTKWRKGNKKNLVKRAIEGYIIVDGEEWTLPEDMVIDALAVEADRKVNGPVEAPEWLTEDLIEKLVNIMDKDMEDVSETLISYKQTSEKLFDLISSHIHQQLKFEDNDYELVPDTFYDFEIEEIYPGYVIYRVTQSNPNRKVNQLYKQMYSIDGQNVDLVGDPIKVAKTYVSAESDVDEPVSSESTEFSMELTRQVELVGAAIRKRFNRKSDVTDDFYWVSVEEIYEDYVIYGITEGGKKEYFYIEYEIDDNEDVELIGEPRKVEQTYVFLDVEDNESTEAESGRMNVVVIEGDNGTIAVEVNSDMLIVNGPKNLIGKALPPIPEQENQESAVSSVCELSVNENDITFVDVSEEKLTTPGGRSVDAIVKIIRPGPGNRRDRFYYTSEAIKNTIGIFNGTKMYKNHQTLQQIRESNGQPRSVDDWVATIKEVWTNEAGEAFGGITFVDNHFYEKAKKGKDELGVSVRGRVRARPGQINGQNYNVVEGFTHGESVDFVTEAGAGGGIAAIAESDIMENDMELENVTLDQLVEARPDLMAEYTARLNADADTSESDVVEAQEGLTREEVMEIVESAVQSAIEPLQSQIQESAVATTRSLVKQRLLDAGLPGPTAARITREFHDRTFEAVEATSETPAKSSVEVAIEAIDQAIAEAKTELNEATKGFTKVEDGGVSESAVGVQTPTRVTPSNGASKSVFSALGIQGLGLPTNDMNDEVVNAS